MRKALGSIVLLIALAVCAAALVACDPPSSDQATPQSIEFVDKDGVNRYTYWDLGTFDHGTEYEDILPSFTLDLCYSDGSAKALAEGEYTVSYLKIDMGEVPLAEMPAVPDAGHYQIVFDKDEFQARMIFTVESVMRAGLALSLARSEWEYDESPAGITLEGYTPSESAPAEYFCVSKTAYNALSADQKAEYWLHLTPLYALGDEPCTVAVGEYYAYAKIPASGNYTDSYTAITPGAAFTVKKAVLRYDASVASNLRAVFNYSSGELGKVELGRLAITSKDFTVGTSLKDRTGVEILGSYVWTDTSTLVDASDDGKPFAAIYRIDPLLEGNYTVENGNIPVSVEIAKGSVYRPSLNIPGGKLHAAGESNGPYPDNALPYVVVNDIGGYNVHIYGAWDENTMQVTVAKDGGEPTNARVGKNSDGSYYVNFAFITPGTYTVTLSLKDKTDFVWWEGDAAVGTDDIAFTFEVKEKKSVPVPTAHLRDSATDTDGVDFITLDGNAHIIDFTDFTDGAISPEFNGEYSYPIVDTENSAYYLLEANKLEALVDTSVGYGTITVTLAPDDEYTWEDGSVTPVEYTCRVNGGSTFFPGIKVAADYTVFDPNDQDPAAAEVMQLLTEWFGAEGAGKMQAARSHYTAAVYFTAFRDGESLAQYIGTVKNTHDDPQNFGTYSMSFDLADIADKSAPACYRGTANVEAGGLKDSTIYPNDNAVSVDKITDYDTPFFLIAKVDCSEAVQSENITYAYATNGDRTVIRIEGESETTAEGSSVSSEVYMIFRNGEYVGHEINTTVTEGDVSTTIFLQFALAE